MIKEKKEEKKYEKKAWIRIENKNKNKKMEWIRKGENWTWMWLYDIVLCPFIVPVLKFGNYISP